MAMLFDVSTDNIGLHVANIFAEGELDSSTTEKFSVVQTEEKSNVRKAHFPHSDRPIKMFSSDMIISVGYRVKSKRGILFRRWANLLQQKKETDQNGLFFAIWSR